MVDIASGNAKFCNNKIKFKINNEKMSAENKRSISEPSPFKLQNGTELKVRLDNYKQKWVSRWAEKDFFQEDGQKRNRLPF